MATSIQVLGDIASISQVLEEEEDMLQLMNNELDKQVEKDMQEIETLIIPDSPKQVEPEPEPKDPDLDEEEKQYQLMNAELDKQIAQDMEAIKSYINKTDNDTFSERIQFFSNIDSSHINNCVDKNATDHILYQHTALGTIKWHICTQCDFRTNSKEKLRGHVIQRHSNPGSKTVVCSQCTFTTTNNVELIKHIQVAHKELKGASQCAKCNSGFKKEYELLRHLKEDHGVVAFPCQKCDFISVDESELSQHVVSEHLRLNVSWYKCAQCAYRTAKKINLDRHVMYKHSLF